MALTAIAGYFAIRAKYLEHENEELEEKNEGLEIKGGIDSTIEKASAKAEKAEEEKQANINDSDWRDKI